MRRTALCALTVAAITCGPAFLAVLYAAAPTLGITPITATNSGTTVTLSPTGLTSGSAFAVIMTQAGAGVRTYTISDTNSNSYTSAVGPISSSASTECQIWYALATANTAGATTITIQQSSTAVTFRGTLFEIKAPGGATMAADTASSNTEAGGSTNHKFAAAMTSAADVAVVAGSASGASVGTFTPTSSPAFTQFDASSATSKFQYALLTSALSANDLDWTSSNGVASAGCSMSLKAVTSSSGGSRLSLLGVGN